MRRDFFRVVIGTKSLFCFACNFESYAAHRTPPLSAARSSSSRIRLARSSTRRVFLLISCAHGKLNVKHHRTTPKSEIHHSSREINCAGEKIEQLPAPNVYNKRHSSWRVRSMHHVYKRGRFPQTRDLWRKSASMGGTAPIRT